MRAAATMAVLGALQLGASAGAIEVSLNDGWSSGNPVTFQGGFMAGEIAAVRLTPTVQCPCQVTGIRLLFGSTAVARAVSIYVWEDSGSLAPGALRFHGRRTLTGSTDLQTVDLASEGIVVSGPFRVGIGFTATGLPSIANDADGTVDGARNFLYSAGNWSSSTTFGITGDWVIRAVTDFPALEVAGVDAWAPGDGAGFQTGFITGEMAAVRVTTLLPCPCTLLGAQVLFGGAAGSASVTLRVWEDSGAATIPPGPPVTSADYLLVRNDTELQEMPLPDSGVEVASSFRIGIEFSINGAPSIARDNDGTLVPERNFAYLIDGTGAWWRSETLGFLGDWILRAQVQSGELFHDSFESTNLLAWSAAVP